MLFKNKKGVAPNHAGNINEPTEVRIYVKEGRLILTPLRTENSV